MGNQTPLKTKSSVSRKGTQETGLRRFFRGRYRMRHIPHMIDAYMHRRMSRMTGGRTIRVISKRSATRGTSQLDGSLGSRPVALRLLWGQWASKLTCVNRIEIFRKPRTDARLRTWVMTHYALLLHHHCQCPVQRATLSPAPPRSLE